MTAKGVGIFTIDFPDPQEINYPNNEFKTVPSTLSFQYPIRENIQTLSTKNTRPGRDPHGILYVPDLASDGCKSNETQFVQNNATRLSNLPPNTNYDLVAFAPWFSPECILEYFQSARVASTRAFLTYQPNGGNMMPPVLNDASWGLNDGGKWQTDNSFPTYAISGSAGGIIADQLRLYSGSVKDAPDGEELATLYNPSDYIRLWATVDTGTSNTLPSLWVFLVIVLGLLIGIITSTSFCMHVIQRRRRNNLRRRVINGEVDLEALGVKRLTVPQEYLDKLPIYTYIASSGEDIEKNKATSEAPNMPSPTIAAGTSQKTVELHRRSSAPTASQPGSSSAFSQPTCPICLDDFEPNETQVRELPCHHLFHPDCVDTFLLNHSSLCPMCKKSVLPVGYCPTKITNIMVRRERVLSRMRQRSAANATANGTSAPTILPSSQPQPPPAAHTSTDSQARAPRAFGSLGSRLGGAFGGRRIFSAPGRTQAGPPDVEMATTTPMRRAPGTADSQAPLNIGTSTVSSTTTSQQASQTNNPACPPRENNRSEWVRHRALTLLENRNVPADADDEDRTGPGWKRALRKVFPGFR